PNPESTPTNRPLAIVRRMHSNAIGPTGAAIASPIATPLSSTNINTDLPSKNPLPPPISTKPS
ncbi:hypothetical protein, partial [cf. Phormidesmis sp. LEGE 11477]|uniref:hypothetical protein n=1 Tax=cf. Phormidesmis sp. LEGE 11477 TaxID=1828680 RepID=UPI001A018A69